MSRIEIIPVEYGKSVLPGDQVFRGGDSNVSYDILFMIYLIKAGEKLILADAGCETMPGFVMRDFIGPVKALEKIGVSPKQITDVIITHSHHDHIESVNYFKDSNIYIQKDEYNAGKGYISDGLKVILFDDEAELYPGVRAVKIGGHSKGSCVVEIEKENKIYVIAGDECYSRQCIEKQIPTGCSVCPEKSEEFIKKYKDDKYVLLLCHDK